MPVQCWWSGSDTQRPAASSVYTIPENVSRILVITVQSSYSRKQADINFSGAESTEQLASVETDSAYARDYVTVYKAKVVPGSKLTFKYTVHGHCGVSALVFRC